MTYIFVGGRRWGKTTEMLRWMRKAPEWEARILICHSKERAMDLLRENRDLASWHFISIHEAKEYGLGLMSGVKHRYNQISYGIDDLDLVLSQLVGLPITRASATGMRLPTPPEDMNQVPFWPNE